MKRRSGFVVMARLVGLVRPLTGFMVLAVVMGLAGHLLAAFITILGGYAVLGLLGFDVSLSTAELYQRGSVDYLGVLIPTIALFSSFGPAVALANLGSTLQNTFAAGNRVLDILDETPAVEEVSGRDGQRLPGRQRRM